MSMKTLSKFKYNKILFEDVFIIKNNKIYDNRGCFFENYRRDFFYENLGFEMVQENISRSSKDVLRGMHFQIYPFCQSKIVSVNSGKILDIIIDLRIDSKTFKHWGAITLDTIDDKQIFIPKGFAHGFLSLSDNTQVCYKVDSSYNPNSERSIIWDDKDINIDWPDINPVMSKKDLEAKSFIQNFNEKNFIFG